MVAGRFLVRRVHSVSMAIEPDFHGAAHQLAYRPILSAGQVSQESKLRFRKQYLQLFHTSSICMATCWLEEWERCKLCPRGEFPRDDFIICLIIFPDSIKYSVYNWKRGSYDCHVSYGLLKKHKARS